MRTGITNLPLHGGRAPKWLFNKMRILAREILLIIREDYSTTEILRRLSDPYWFQSLGCVLGYDWHSSGLTTVTCAAIKSGLKGIESDIGLFCTGGKGRTSRKTPLEIARAIDSNNLSLNAERLQYASKICAKVDSALIQDDYQLYHHSFFFDINGKWTVIQQGLPSNNSESEQLKNLQNPHSTQLQIQFTSPLHYGLSGATKDNTYQRSSFGTELRQSNSTRNARKTSNDLKSPKLQSNSQTKQYARRYHWMSENQDSFTNSPNNKIISPVIKSSVLNLTSHNSSGSRNAIVELINEKPWEIVSEYQKIISLHLPKREWISKHDILPRNLKKILLSTYENPPQSFEELTMQNGVGAKSLRALNLISEITHGTRADWQDPAKYSFAHGGKDGYPYPVDKENYDQSIRILKKAITRLKLNRADKNRRIDSLMKMWDTD